NRKRCVSSRQAIEGFVDGSISTAHEYPVQAGFAGLAAITLDVTTLLREKKVEVDVDQRGELLQRRTCNPGCPAATAGRSDEKERAHGPIARSLARQLARCHGAGLLEERNAPRRPAIAFGHASKHETVPRARHPYI